MAIDLGDIFIAVLPNMEDFQSALTDEASAGFDDIYATVLPDTEDFQGVLDDATSTLDDVIIPIGADADEFQATLDGTVGAIDDVVLPVTADTDQFTSAIDDVASNIDDVIIPTMPDVDAFISSLEEETAAIDPVEVPVIAAGAEGGGGFLDKFESGAELADVGEHMGKEISTGMGGVLSSEMPHLGLLAGGAFSAYFGMKSIDAFEEVEKQTQRLTGNLTIAFGPELADQLTAPLVEFAKQASLTSSSSVSDILKMQATLAALGGAALQDLGPDGATGFVEDLTQALLDLSAATAKPIQGLMRTLAPNILNNPARAVKTLTTMGALTSEQITKINALIAAGDKQAASQMIVNDLQEKYAGQAENSLTATDRLHSAFALLEEEVGQAFAPVLEGVVKLFEAMPVGIQKAIVVFGIMSTAWAIGGKVLGILKAQALQALLGLTGLETGMLGGVFATEGLTGAVVALGASLWATLAPFIEFIAIAALVAGAAYLIFKNWDSIGPVFDKLWHAIQPAIMAIWDALKQLGAAAMDLWHQIQPSLAQLGEAFVLLWHIIGPVIGFIAQIWVAVFVAQIKIGAAIITAIVQAIAGAIEIFAALWASTWNGAMGAFRTFVNFFIDATNLLIVGINLLIRSYNLLPWHDDIATIPHLEELPQDFGKVSEAADGTKESMDGVAGASFAAADGVGELNQQLVDHVMSSVRVHDALRKTDMLFGEQFQDVESLQTAWDDWQNSTADSLNFVTAKLGDLSSRTRMTARQIDASLKRAAASMKDFGHNLKIIADDGTAGATELVNQLIAMGPAGQDMAAKIAAAGPKVRASIEHDIGGSLKDAQSMAQTLERTLTDGFRNIAAAILVATGKADNMADAINQIPKTVTIHWQYDVAVRGAPPPPGGNPNTNPPDPSGDGHSAGGGFVQPRRQYVVGEHGPELFTSDIAGRIIPNHQLREEASSSEVQIVGDLELVDGRAYITGIIEEREELGSRKARMNRS